MKSIIASAALLAATVSATTFHGKPRPGTDPNNGLAKVVNRCSYPVYVWSIYKQDGCQGGDMYTLRTGDIYDERMANGTNGGISIKLSKTPACVLGELTQLEYNIETGTEYAGNFLDMSFVDCTGNPEDCPGRTDGYYLKSGNQNGDFMSAVDNEHCPIFSASNAEEVAKVSYLLPDDRQTKFCNQKADLTLYLCGGEAPGAEDNYSAPSSSAAPSSEIESSSAQPSSSSSSSSEAAPSTTEEANFVVAAAAAVTPAPVAAAPVVKTEVVYVTEYIKARHAHGRRHQQFHA